MPAVTTLGVDDEEHAKRLGFKTRVVVRLTGHRVARKSNRVELGDLPVNLPHADMEFLLALVRGLHTTVDGWCPKQGLVDERIVPQDVDNAVSRLKRSLSPGLRDVAPEEFVEVRNKRVRLSTHRALVGIDRATFVGHDNAKIGMLLSQIPHI